MSLAPYHVPDFTPVADGAAIVRGDSYRFSVLTPRLIRAEYSPEGEFEDRPSQVFWHRDQPVPEFESTVTDEQVLIETDELTLEYTVGEPFSQDTLSGTLHDSDADWQYGDETGDMGGTIRTLDGIEGSADLDQGLLGTAGWTVVNDADSLVFEEDGWVAPRDTNGSYEDLYLFGYGQEYLDCLQDFTAVSGEVPLIPRWALGNWWSRYEAYSADEFTALMNRFRDEKLPLSVCVIDMDWHIVDNEYHGGWTGWTWNRDLFPDPAGFIEELHNCGLQTTLNIHPADGVHPHEDSYEAFAEQLGMDPDEKEPIEFEASDPSFLRGYFDTVINRIEDEQDIDFWWIDWQQWDESFEMDGLDPLWALNHLHSLDRTRDGRRPFILSRWGGLGGHRYPIGFSGDAFISWNSLAFQPYLTSTGANVNFGWWSHDIGGHFGGTGAPRSFGELCTRWLQFGVFSPINRIHTGNVDYLDKRPWEFEPTIRKLLGDAMTLRHELVPYLYTMAWRNHNRGVPLVQPMYYHHPDTEVAYSVPQQYYFGSELLVAPHVRPLDDETNLARQSVWLPDECDHWFDFQSGERYSEGFHARYGDLEDIPVYAKAGAIVPLDGEPEFGDIDTPDRLTIRVFPGGDNSFDLYEDAGTGQAYQDGEYTITTLRQEYEPGQLRFTVEAPEGALEHIPETRTLELCFPGLCDDIEVSVDAGEATVEYNESTNTQKVTVPDHDTSSALSLTITTDSDSLLVDQNRRMAEIQTVLRHLEVPARSKSHIEGYAREFLNGERTDLDWLGNFAEIASGEQIRAIVETICDVGIAHIDSTEAEHFIIWNDADREDITFQLSRFRMGEIPLNAEGSARSDPLPECEIISSDTLQGKDWTLTVDYAGAGSVFYSGDGQATR